MKHIKEFKEFVNEGNNTYIVFLPVDKKGNVDLKDPLFGAYNEDDEWDRIKPYKKADNYSTSYSFPSLAIAKEYVELVKATKGDMDSPKWDAVGDFDKKNKV